MGLIDGLKEVVNVAQQAKNFDLYKQLLELYSQALDMQAEIDKLNKENDELKDYLKVKSKIERHEGTYVTLIDDVNHIPYCSGCWDKVKLLVQVVKTHQNKFYCPACKNQDNFRRDIYKNKVNDLSNIELD